VKAISKLHLKDICNSDLLPLHKAINVCAKFWLPLFIANITLIFLTENYAKSRWKSLRDTFRKEFKKFKEQTLTHGSSAPIPRWLHYKDLQFLEDVMQSRKLSPNVLATSVHEKKYQPPQAHNEEIKSVEERQEYDAELSDEDSYTIVQSRSTSTPCQPQPITSAQKHKRARSSLNYQKENLHLERNEMERVARQQDDDDDDDLNFFKSLVPYMKKLPPYKKLCLRSQFQNLLANEISAIENN
jgi:hypothetical protein